MSLMTLCQIVEKCKHHKGDPKKVALFLCTKYTYEEDTKTIPIHISNNSLTIECEYNSYFK